MITIQDTIRKAIHVKGYEILMDKRNLCIILEDLSPALKEEREFIEKIYHDAVGKLFYDACKADAAHKSDFIADADAYLEEQFGYNEKWRRRLISYFEGIILPGGVSGTKSGSGIFEGRKGQTDASEDREAFRGGTVQDGGAERIRDEAYCYLWGIDISQDLEKAGALFAEAIKLYEQRAERGDAEAQYWCGFFYEHRIDVKKNQARLKKCFKKASKEDSGRKKLEGAKHCAAYKTRKGLEKAEKSFCRMVDDYDGVQGLAEMREAKNDKKAFNWYEKAAEQGDRRAQYRLGRMYQSGKGVEQDTKKGLTWIVESVKQKYSDAQYWLGEMYRDGNRGVKQDNREAARWFKAAAVQGDSDAQNCLGMLYELGEGVTKDYGRALECYQKSAAQGNPYGQYNLGNMYEKGLGVNRDYKMAMTWYEKSDLQGGVRTERAIEAIRRGKKMR